MAKLSHRWTQFPFHKSEWQIAIAKNAFWIVVIEPNNKNLVRLLIALECQKKTDDYCLSCMPTGPYTVRACTATPQRDSWAITSTRASRLHSKKHPGSEIDPERGPHWGAQTPLPGPTMTRKSVNLTRNVTQSWVNLTPLFVKSTESWPISRGPSLTRNGVWAPNGTSFPVSRWTRGVF